MNLACLNRFRAKNLNSGFTLLEVLISMAIMAFMGLAIYQATTETFKLRDALSTEGNFYNGIRLAMAILQRDISMMYSPVATAPGPSPSSSPNPQAPPNANQMGVIMSDDLSTTSLFWSPATDQSGLRPSRFIGTENKMSFISVSHIRIYKDTAESEFAKITYELKRDTSKQALADTYVLVKTETPNAFVSEEYRDNAKRSYEILPGVRKLKYSYYQRDGETWKVLNSWDSNKEETKNDFPDIIEVKLEVVGERHQSFDGIYKFRPEIPTGAIEASF